MKKVFKVYDEEWEAIVGEVQLREFAVQQVQCSPDDYIEENIWQAKDEDKPMLLEVVQRIWDNKVEPKDLTDKEVELILTERSYEIEELNIY